MLVKKTAWLILSLLMVVGLLLSSCKSDVTAGPTEEQSGTGQATETQQPQSDTSGKTAPDDAGAPHIINITAENLSFDESLILVPAGRSVSIVFQNKDNTRHNFAVYVTRGAGNPIFQGEPVLGPGTITYTFITPEEPRLYYFQCDFHPSTMNGEFIVAGSAS
jgi:plastocyanin